MAVTPVVGELKKSMKLAEAEVKASTAAGMPPLKASWRLQYSAPEG